MKSSGKEVEVEKTTNEIRTPTEKATRNNSEKRELGNNQICGNATAKLMEKRNSVTREQDAARGWRMN
ncbi:MAG: hypothetical protein LBU56_03080 [Rickettsiales bacterium]|jgi:hypothetical protein|nr:hypothetical protein [Rickettsiales bacterium]